MAVVSEEERIAKEKAALESMRNAQSNMRYAIERISTLETALAVAIESLESYSKYIPSRSYTYRGEKEIREMMLEKANSLRTKL